MELQFRETQFVIEVIVVFKFFRDVTCFLGMLEEDMAQSALTERADTNNNASNLKPSDGYIMGGKTGLDPKTSKVTTHPAVVAIPMSAHGVMETNAMERFATAEAAEKVSSPIKRSTIQVM